MKNIHILPTDKPSRLRIGNNGNFVLGLMQSAIISKNDSYTNQHIYITSEEEIKIGDWVYSLREGLEPILKQKVNTIGVNNDEMMKKIILTTDQSLDNVQAIDDEFLEWFVKNPSCESVEVEREKAVGYAEDRQRTFYGKYKIIIPKEEQCTCKKHDPYCCHIHGSCPTCVKKEEPKQDYSGVHLRHCYQGEYEDGCKYGEDDCPAKPLQEPKQETLEEAAENYGNSIGNKNGTAKFDFIRGAKWQQERMCNHTYILISEQGHRIIKCQKCDNTQPI